MGVSLSVLVVIVCPRRAPDRAVDTAPLQLQRNLRTAAVWSKWIKFVCFAIKILTQRVAAAHYGKLGNQLKHSAANVPGRAQSARHWGRLGHRLRQHEVSILIAAAR